jgi:hypothetical protein
VTFVPLNTPVEVGPSPTSVRKPIGECRWRERVRVVGRVRSLRVQPWEGALATLEATLVDDTGGITVIFLGRQRIGGVGLGARMEVEGRVIEARGKLAILNPEYTLLPVHSEPVGKAKKDGKNP